MGSNQAPRVTNLYLNQVNDPAPGVPLASPSGSIVSSYPGQVGGILTLDAKTALKLSDTVNVGTLYAGLYQYVKFKADSTASNARGQVVFWSDFDNFEVTPDAAAAMNGKVAGITLNAVTKGQYGWIQVAGKASVKFGTVTKATPADGDLVVLTATPANTADAPEEATSVTSAVLKRAMGIALEAPVTDAVKLVLLRYLSLNIGQ